VKRTPGVLALVAAAVLVALVGIGIAYVAHQDSGHVSGGPAPHLSSTPASPTLQITPSPAPPSQSPGRPVTMTPQPSPTPKPTHEPTRKPEPPPPPPVLDFTLSSFNVLGASHTTGNGKRPGMASGRVRAGRAADLVSRHGSDVVGFQELQAPQLGALQRQTAMDFWPGFALETRDTENSIGWRRDEFVAVEKKIVRIPYFNGSPRAMPYVKLRSLHTGVEAWFANFHNPADTARFHRQQRFRDRATRVEIRLANRLIATGVPVFITGDMNERDSYFCAMTSGAPMIAARGGTNNGGCQPDRPRAIDWIFGSQGVTFSGYFEDRSRLVGITTDHPVVVSQVRIVGKSPEQKTE
jgi:hypothetical protein